MKLIILSQTFFRRHLAIRQSVQLYTFTDASFIGTSAVVYVRVEYQPEYKLLTHYVKGKSKVAPIKQLNIPKLELKAPFIEFLLVIFAKNNFNLTLILTYTCGQTVNL